MPDAAVILATGGFASDIQFRMIQNPGLDASMGSTKPSWGHSRWPDCRLCRSAPVPVHLSWIQLGPWGCADESGYGRGASFASYSVYPFGILVDPANGQRIVNEWADRRTRSDAILKTGHPCVGLVDAGRCRCGRGKAFSPSLKRGSVKAFENLTDLASAFTIPPGHLEKTVKAYNLAVSENKSDTFGKPLERGAKLVARSPFYAIRLWPKVHYTPGGIGINSKAEVIDLHHRSIPHLFAAGEVCGGIHGASRLGSCALTESIVFGRIAGKQAAMNSDA